MAGPSGNSEFCFPSNLNIPLGFASGNIEVLGKQNSLFPLGPVIKCLLTPVKTRDSPMARYRFSIGSQAQARYFALLFGLAKSTYCCCLENRSVDLNRTATRRNILKKIKHGIGSESWQALTFICLNSIAASMTLSIDAFKKTSRIRPPVFRGSKRQEMNSSKEPASLVNSSSSGPFLFAKRRSSKFVCRKIA